MSSARHGKIQKLSIFISRSLNSPVTAPWTVHKIGYVSTRTSCVVISSTKFWLMFSMCLSSLCMYWKVFKRKMESMARVVRDVDRISVTQARFLGRIGYMELVTWHDWSWLVFFHRVTGVGTFRWPLVHGYGPAIDHIFTGTLQAAWQSEFTPPS